MFDETENDDWLMNRAKAGDTAAFDRIVRRHQHRLQRFATRMLGGDHAAGSDIVVGVFLRLWGSRGAYRPCGKLGAWLLRVTNRLCLDALAEGRPPTGLAGEGVVPPPCFEASELALAVRAAVCELPETHRSVLILSVYEELSYDEIAEALEISPGTVASRKNHAIAALRRKLAAWETR
jgi:RNA polymerase sigma-70 factor (ECF subfamily)